MIQASLSVLELRGHPFDCRRGLATRPDEGPYSHETQATGSKSTIQSTTPWRPIEPAPLYVS